MKKGSKRKSTFRMFTAKTAEAFKERAKRAKRGRKKVETLKKKDNDTMKVRKIKETVEVGANKGKKVKKKTRKRKAPTSTRENHTNKEVLFRFMSFNTCALADGDKYSHNLGKQPKMADMMKKLKINFVGCQGTHKGGAFSREKIDENTIVVKHGSIDGISKGVAIFLDRLAQAAWNRGNCKFVTFGNIQGRWMAILLVAKGGERWLVIVGYAPQATKKRDTRTQGMVERILASREIG